MNSQTQSQDCNLRLKCIVVGNFNVGKTKLVYRFARDEFQQNSYATIGIDFQTKSISFENLVVRINIWDTPPNRAHTSIFYKYFYRSVDCALIIYDIADRESFKQIGDCLRILKENSEADVLIALIGNKLDLRSSRQVHHDEALQFAQENDLLFFEVSALSGENIKQAFEQIIHKKLKIILQSEENYENFTNRRTLQNQKLVEAKGNRLSVCC